VNAYSKILRFLNAAQDRLNALRRLRPPEDPEERKRRAEELREARKQYRAVQRTASWMQTGPTRAFSLTKAYAPGAKRRRLRKLQRRARKQTRRAA
jgi:hypothetical protein